MYGNDIGIHDVSGELHHWILYIHNCRTGVIDRYTIFNVMYHHEHITHCGKKVEKEKGRGLIVSLLFREIYMGYYGKYVEATTKGGGLYTYLAMGKEPLTLGREPGIKSLAEMLDSFDFAKITLSFIAIN